MDARKRLKNCGIDPKTTMFLLCWTAYAAIYFGRVNLPVAAPDIQQTMSFTKTQIGLPSTLFFWIYAFGQLINSNLGDRISGYTMIFFGLFVTGVANLLFGAASVFSFFLIVWGVNGFAQSMLWGPIVRILSDWYPSNQKSKVSIAISTSMVAGYLAAWGLSGRLTVLAGWRYAFIVPGVFITMYAFVWLSRSRRLQALKTTAYQEQEKHAVASTQPPPATPGKPLISMAHLLFRKKLWVIACICITQGLVKESMSLWGPIFIMERNNLDMSALPGTILVIPFINFAGLLLAGRLNKLFRYKEKYTILSMYTLCGCFIGFMIVFPAMSLPMSVLASGGVLGAMFGANSMLLGVIPMKYAQYGRSSSAAGFLDFLTYLAAGVSATVTGALANNAGWNAVLSFWLSIVITGVAVILFALWYDREPDPPVEAEQSHGNTF